MKLISEMLPLEHIVLDMKIGSKKRLFEEVGQLLASDDGLSQTEIFDCLIAREKLGTTGLGQGVAIPHGRHSALKTAIAAFVRIKEPIDFDAPDNKPVSLVFVLLVPEQATGEHLEILSHLAQRFSEKTVREALLNCEKAEDVQCLLAA